jgi:hypothetical protein
LFDAIRNRLDTEIAKAHGAEAEKLGELRESLPASAETFGKYLRDAGIKKNTSRRDRSHGRSIVHQSDI